MRQGTDSQTAVTNVHFTPYTKCNLCGVMCLLVIFSDENESQKEAVPASSTQSKFIHCVHVVNVN